MLLLLYNNPHASPVDDGILFKPNSVTNKVTEVDVAALKTRKSALLNFVQNIFFLFLFLIHDFPP